LQTFDLQKRDKKMKKLIVGLCVATLSMGTMAAGVAPVMAAPHHDNHSKFEQHGNYAYYNGHKGYKTRHAGYRFYNGYWFPPTAFVIGGLIAGGIIGSIIASQHH
jgi:hypothetical protein